MSSDAFHISGTDTLDGGSVLIMPYDEWSPSFLPFSGFHQWQRTYRARFWWYNPSATCSLLHIYIFIRIDMSQWIIPLSQVACRLHPSIHCKPLHCNLSMDLHTVFASTSQMIVSTMTCTVRLNWGQVLRLRFVYTVEWIIILSVQSAYVACDNSRHVDESTRYGPWSFCISSFTRFTVYTCVLLCFIDPGVRKIRNEASSCPGIFSRTLRFYYVASSPGSPLPHLLDGHRKLYNSSKVMRRASSVSLGKCRRVGSASRWNARIDDTPTPQHQHITKHHIC